MPSSIELKVIPHKEQRYDTVGDYWADAEGWHFRVSDLKNWRYHALIFAHEFVEFCLVVFVGISEPAIVAFDEQFEADRASGLHKPEDEPGDDLQAPYFYQHQAATCIERVFAVVLGVNWKEYDAACLAVE